MKNKQNIPKSGYTLSSSVSDSGLQCNFYINNKCVCVGHDGYHRTNEETSPSLSDTYCEGGYGWVIVLASFFHAFIFDGISSSFGVLYPYLLEKYKSNAFITSFSGSLFSSYLIMGAIASCLIKKTSFRFVSFLGGLLASIAILMSAHCSNIYLFLLCYGVFGGCSVGLVFVSSRVIVNLYFHKKRGLTNGIVTSGSGVGLFLMAPIINQLLDTYSLDGTLWILSAIMLNCCVFAALYRNPSFDTPNSHNAKSNDINMNNIKCKCENELQKSPTYYNQYEIGMPCDSEDRKPFLNQDYQKQQESKSSELPNKFIYQSAEISSHTSLFCSSAEIIRPQNHRSSNKSNWNLNKSLPSIIQRRDICPLNLQITNNQQFRNIKKAYISRPHPLLTPVKHKILIPSNIRKDNVINTQRDSVITTTLNDSIAGYKLADLLKIPSFNIFCLSSCLIQMGSNVPQMFLAGLAFKHGVCEYTSAYIIGAIGASNMVGRVVSGWLANVGFDPGRLINVAMLMASVLCFLSPLYTTVFTFGLFAVTYGFLLGFFPPLQPLVIVKYFGIRSLRPGFGFMTTLKGVAGIIGPPIAGKVYDLSLDYSLSIMFTGIVLLLSTIVGEFMICMKRSRHIETSLKEKTLQFIETPDDVNDCVLK